MAVISTSLKKESRDRYLTYALSVVSGRALPDVRDGLKPVQRRILYAMSENLNLKPTGSHKKSAAVVGEVLAKYHPHGDIACYEAMVRMAQSFSMRYPMVDGQGNFGSLDGDSAAAYRYTEAKLQPIAGQVLGEIKEDTVSFRDNFDSSTQEPVVLPSRIPNLLCNGASGIAVGMATNIPPHNLSDVVDALLALSHDEELSNAKLAKTLKGPDFPTGCLILNSQKEIADIYQSGRGSIRMRGEWKLEDLGRGKKAIVITSIPYALNKSLLVEKIAQVIIDRKVPQLHDVRDESTEEVRVVVELVSGADEEIAINYLFKHTPLESNFAVNLTALVPVSKNSCRPQLLSLKEILQYFLDFRTEIVERRLEFERRNLLARIHILEGFCLIFDALDEAIKIVRKSTGRSDAAKKLEKRFKLTEIQAFAVVDMRIYQLSRTNIDEIRAELAEKLKRVKEIDSILKSAAKVAAIVREDLEAVKKEFGDKRLSKIVRNYEEVELNESDYVVQEDVFAIVTREGWLKRIRQNNELSQTRLREGDSILCAHAVSTLETIIFFTNLGTVYSLKVTDFPSSSGYGSPIQKLCKFKDGERIIATYELERERDYEYELGDEPLLARSQPIADGDTLLFVTEKGMGLGLTLEGLGGLKRSGKRVMKTKKDDAVASVSSLEKKVAFFTEKGSALVISAKEVPVRTQAGVGVVLMGVRKDDKLVSAISFSGKTKFLIETEKGKERSVSSDSLTSGKRGLKGTKAVSRGTIVNVVEEV